MTFSVIWTPEAERDLLKVYATAPSTGPITFAVLSLNMALQSEPDRIGESRPLGTRIAFVPPLGVRFEVRWRERLVRIVQAWYFEDRT